MYIYLNSKDNNLATKNNAEVRLNLDEAIRTQTKMRLKHFQLSNSHYNVTSKNNALELDSVSVLLTPGSYTLADLLSEVDSALTSSSSGDDFTVSRSTTTGLITILNNTGNYTLNFNVANNSAADLLGFGQTTTYSGASTYSGSFNPELSGDIFVHIDTFSSEYITSDFKKPTFVIPNDEARHDVIYFNEKTDFDQYTYTANGFMKSVTVRLKDEWGQLLQNAAAWRMVLEVVE